jgi:hypothetical protein
MWNCGEKLKAVDDEERNIKISISTLFLGCTVHTNTPKHLDM